MQYTNPAAYPPLEHSSRLLADEGWEIHFWGTGGLGAANLRFPPHPRIRVKRLDYCPAGWRQKFHFAFFCLWTWVWALRCGSPWIYVSEATACPVALGFCLFPWFKVIYHEHDSPQLPSASTGSCFNRFVLWSRRQVAKRAQFCILPNAQRAEEVKSSLRITAPILSVWNCPSKTEVIAEHPDRVPSPLSVYYHGNLSPHLFPLTLIESLAFLPAKVCLEAIGYTTLSFRDYVEKLRSHASAFGVGDQVIVKAAVPRSELWPQMGRHHLGIACMPMKSDNLNFRHMVGASNKPFDYLASGLALLVSDLPEWKKTFVEPGYGLACNPDDPRSIAQALQWFVDHPDQTRQMGRLGRKRILEDWNYESQFAPVLKRLR